MAGNNNNLNNNNDTDPKQVVRIDQDSDDNLQAMFDMVLKPAENRKIPLQLPFRMRNLPDSFFNPPPTGSKSPSIAHSRENSGDSAFGSGTTTICSPSGINPVTNRLQISHSRAHSSPASLQQTYAGLSASVAAQNANNTNNANNNNNTTSSGAAGGGGGSGAGGGGTTNGNSGATASTQQRPTQNIQPNHMKQRSYDVVSAIQLQEELGDLPEGWEQARTAEGQIYYLK